MGDRVVLAYLNAVNWTVTAPISSVLLNVIHANNEWLAVTQGSASIGRASDGVTWTSQAVGDRLNGITVGAGIYVGVGGYSTGDIPSLVRYRGSAYASPDATTWTRQYFSEVDRTSPNPYLVDVAYGGNQFVAVGGQIITSSNGLSWTTRATGQALISVTALHCDSQEA